MTLPKTNKDTPSCPEEKIYRETDKLALVWESRRLDFPNATLPPGFMIYGYCTQGAATFRMDGKLRELHPGDLYINIGNQTLEAQAPEADFRGDFILISYQCLQDGIAGLHQLWPYLLYIYEHPVLHLDENERRRMEDNYRLVRQRLHDSRHHYRQEVIDSLIRLYYFDTCDILSRRCPEEWNRQTRGYDLFDRFIHLAGKHFREERNVGWYSQQLCLTPKYLSEVVKSVSGKTAGQWINNFVLMEIKMLLRNTGLSVKEIANKMHFPNQSFLGKYFKNATGQSPSAYRRH